MWIIKNNKQIDFLWENNIIPRFEICGLAIYDNTKELHSALERYFIIHTCFPNRIGG